MALYGAHVPPAKKTQLDVLLIEQWCVALSVGPHCAHTGEVGALRLAFEHKADKLSVAVELADADADGEQAASATSGTATAPSGSSSAASLRFDDALNVQSAARRLVAALRGKSEAEQVAELERQLYLFKAGAYTAGVRSVSK